MTRSLDIPLTNETVLSDEDLMVKISDQARLAHEALRNLVQVRNMYDTDTFPLSYSHTEHPNPTDDQLRQAAEEVAALTLHRSSTDQFGLRSAIPDNTNFYQPPSVEVASLLVDAAKETRDKTVTALAEAALPEIDEFIAEPLRYDLHASLGTATPEERRAHKNSLDLEALQEAVKLGKAEERRERLEHYTDDQLQKLSEHDDAVPYDPFADDE